jgi:predicted transposase YdaD
LYVFRHLADLKDRPQKLQDKVFQRLFEAAEIAQFTPNERESYEKSLKYYRDLKNVVDTSHEEGRLEGRAEGLQEGLQKGLQKGKAEGLQEGLQKGKAEGLQEGETKKAIEIAKKMLLQGLDLALIQSVTGLSEEEIKKL